MVIIIDECAPSKYEEGKGSLDGWRNNLSALFPSKRNHLYENETFQLKSFKFSNFPFHMYSFVVWKFKFPRILLIYEF
jgi:hypothetical protein